MSSFVIKSSNQIYQNIIHMATIFLIDKHPSCMQQSMWLAGVQLFNNGIHYTVTHSVIQECVSFNKQQLHAHTPVLIIRFPYPSLSFYFPPYLSLNHVH